MTGQARSSLERPSLYTQHRASPWTSAPSLPCNRRTFLRERTPGPLHESACSTGPMKHSSCPNVGTSHTNRARPGAAPVEPRVHGRTLMPYIYQRHAELLAGIHIILGNGRHYTVQYTHFGQELCLFVRNQT